MRLRDCFSKVLPYEGKDIRIRPMDERDKEVYISMLGNLQDAVIKALWESAISSDNSITFAANLIISGTMVGYGSVNNRKSGCLELGYEVKDEYRGKGYGSQILEGLIRIVSHVAEEKPIARIRADNIVSVHIVEKLGGKKIAEEPSYYEELVERDGAQFWQKYSEFLDHVRTFVYEFDQG